MQWRNNETPIVAETIIIRTIIKIATTIKAETEQSRTMHKTTLAPLNKKKTRIVANKIIVISNSSKMVEERRQTTNRDRPINSRQSRWMVLIPLRRCS